MEPSISFYPGLPRMLAGGVTLTFPATRNLPSTHWETFPSVAYKFATGLRLGSGDFTGGMHGRRQRTP